MRLLGIGKKKNKTLYPTKRAIVKKSKSGKYTARILLNDKTEFVTVMPGKRTFIDCAQIIRQGFGSDIVIEKVG